MFLTIKNLLEIIVCIFLFIVSVIKEKTCSNSCLILKVLKNNFCPLEPARDTTSLLAAPNFNILQNILKIALIKGSNFSLSYLFMNFNDILIRPVFSITICISLKVFFL